MRDLSATAQRGQMGATISFAKALRLPDLIAALARETEGGGAKNRAEDSP